MTFERTAHEVKWVPVDPDDLSLGEMAIVFLADTEDDEVVATVLDGEVDFNTKDLTYFKLDAHALDLLQAVLIEADEKEAAVMAKWAAE